MRGFWGRSDNELERRLRSHRAEPPPALVRRLVDRIGGDAPGRLRPRARYALIALVAAGAIAATASAGGLGVAGGSANHTLKVFHELTGGKQADDNKGNQGNQGNQGGKDDKGDPGKGNGNDEGNKGDDGDDDGGGPHGPPGDDQYKGVCGQPPHKRCRIQVAPQRPKVDPGEDVVITVSLKSNDVSDGTVFVSFATQDGTGTDAAIAGTDYTANSGTLNFPFGANSETVVVHTLVVPPHKKARSFFINFSSSTADINPADSQITVTIN